MAGRRFGEWQMGDHLIHDIRRTVTETDNRAFTPDAAARVVVAASGGGRSAATARCWTRRG